jgi:hypothetical protein
MKPQQKITICLWLQMKKIHFARLLEARDGR